MLILENMEIHIPYQAYTVRVFFHETSLYIVLQREGAQVYSGCGLCVVANKTINFELYCML
jgi:hypothetical protein